MKGLILQEWNVIKIDCWPCLIFWRSWWSESDMHALCTLVNVESFHLYVDNRQAEKAIWVWSLVDENLYIRKYFSVERTGWMYSLIECWTLPFTPSQPTGAAITTRTCSLVPPFQLPLSISQVELGIYSPLSVEKSVDRWSANGQLLTSYFPQQKLSAFKVSHLPVLVVLNKLVKTFGKKSNLKCGLIRTRQLR